MGALLLFKGIAVFSRSREQTQSSINETSTCPRSEDPFATHMRLSMAAPSRGEVTPAEHLGTPDRWSLPLSASLPPSFC